MGDTFVDGLRALAGFLERHPDMPRPGTVRVDIWVDTKEEFRKVARTLGSAEKLDQFDWLYVLRKHFSETVQLDLNITRGLVCERIVTGTRVVPETFTPERVEQIFEWTCPDSIMKEA